MTPVRDAAFSKTVKFSATTITWQGNGKLNSAKESSNNITGSWENNQNYRPIPKFMCLTMLRHFRVYCNGNCSALTYVQRRFMGDRSTLVIKVIKLSGKKSAEHVARIGERQKKLDAKTECKRPFRQHNYQHENNITICLKNWIRGCVVVSSGLGYEPVTGLCKRHGFQERVHISSPA
jgi:hypothetical protein